jgi:hypothetical protein
MAIDAHDNPQVRGIISDPVVAAAGGSSNSNSHNAGGGGGGGGGGVQPQEMQEILSQLRTLLPQLRQVAERGRSS